MKKFFNDFFAKSSTSTKETQKAKNTNLYAEFFKKIEEVIFNFQPKIYSMAQESNIMCKYDEFLITTKDFNLCMGVKLEGLSYAAVNEEEEIEFAQKRNRFFARLNNDIEMNIIAKKEILEIENDTSSINNFYAKEIIEKWEKKIQVYKTKYYLVFSTKTKSIAGFFEGVKEKTTTEQDKNQQKTSLKTALNLKAKKLYELKTNLLSDLADYKPELINADDLLNIFATYANCQKTNLKYSYKLITDCYLTSDVEFKKDYIIFHRNVTQEKYARFISIKSYETDSITSLISSYLLNENLEFTLFIHCESIAKEKAIKKVKDIKAFTQDAFKMDLEFYIQELKSERENMILVSYSVFLEADSLDELNQISDYIKGLLENQGVVAIKETLNQNPLFFSFFPSRGNLNARMRSLQGKNLATLATFESDNLGFKKNAWGNMPITTFQHLSGAPFLFNLHEHDRVGAAGHTLIIGGTGYGKTTLMQFLMMNLLKYNINIFAMDKAQGMYNFTNYIGGEYHDFNEENTENSFKLNPFSLSNTPENNLFLNTFFCKMGNVDAEKRPEEMELEKLIKITIDQLRRTGVDKEHNDKIATLSEFYSSLHYANEQNTLIHERYEKYLKSFFDNEEDALNFKKQLSILNMDTILKDQKLSSLSALYLFHKVQNISKEQNKGFFIFIDELKDYLREETMLENILQSILEIRKMGGVMTMGVQNLDFFETVKKNNSFMSSMTNFIIFPTSNSKSLEIMQKELRLTNSEVDFLKNAPKESRQILYKQATINQSAILSVNFARLGNYLRIFSSEREDVNLTKSYKKEYPNEWRERYLNYKKDEK